MPRREELRRRRGWREVLRERIDAVEVWDTHGVVLRFQREIKEANGVLQVEIESSG